MKQLFFLFLLSGLLYTAKAQEVTCRYGFSYEISYNQHWGKDKLVITSINPNSPAQRAELKPFDIIEEVDGEPITESVLDDIHQFLNPEGKDVVELTIKNINNGTRKVKIKKECKNMLSLSEIQLVEAFAMYAVEDNHERLFTCPFVTSQTNDPVDFAEFKSFDFVGENESQPELAKKINDLIRKELISRGLQHDPVKPDFVVQIYYSFNKNPNHKPKATKNETNDAVYRYDLTQDKWLKLPFLPLSTLETEAEYILKLGFRFEDRKLIRGRIIWECEANELMNTSFSLEDFAFIHVPLMCLQYPYMKYGRNIQFRLSKKKYCYTGLNYSADHISTISSVDPYSPAAGAGIKPYDVLDAIDDKRMDRTSKQFTAAYRQFIVQTLPYRDVTTRFTDANGFSDCIEWDSLKYPQIFKAFNKKKNLAAFSYLFHYAPFINPASLEACSFKLRREGEKLEFLIRPEIRSEITILVD